MFAASTAIQHKSSLIPISFYTNEDCKKAVVRLWGTAELHTSVFTRLIILIRISEYFRTRRWESDNIFDAFPDSNASNQLPMEFFACLNYAYQDFGDSDKWPFLTAKAEEAEDIEEHQPPPQDENTKPNQESKDGIRLGNRRRSVTRMRARQTGGAQGDMTRRLIETDLVSHWLLKVCFAGNRAKEDWLVEQETRMVSLRLCLWVTAINFAMASQDQGRTKDWASHISELFGSLGMPQTMIVTTPALVELDPDMLQVGRHLIKSKLCPEVAPLIKNRRCVISQGNVYVDAAKSAHVIFLSRFTQNLKGSVAGSSAMATKIHQVARQLPVTHLFEKLRAYDPIAASRESATKNQKFERLTPELLSKCVYTSFPLCMVQLISAARAQRHLKHAGRLQLWLFLKDAGLSCDEQISLFRQMWSDPQKFEKEHTYTLRHMYGMEGKREQKGCYGCSRILSPAFPAPRNGEFHGCPYRDLSSDNLRQCLKQIGLKPMEIDEVAERCNSREFELACRCVFERLHPDEDGGDVGISPLNFYQASRRYWGRQK